MKKELMSVENLVTIIIVTYNSKETISQTLKSCNGHKIILIDNNSSDKTVEKAQTVENMNIIKNKRNVGYAKAVNQGIEQVKTPFILLVNPDVILQKDAIKKMVEFMEQKKDCQVQGPKMLENDKKLVYSCRKFPTWNAIIGNRIGGFKKSTDNYLMKKYNHKSPRVVDWVSGGCMMFRPLFRFDERFFLYMEDVDFCTGKKVWYNPNAVVLHAPQYGSQIKPLLFIYHIMSYIKYQLKLISRK